MSSSHGPDEVADPSEPTWLRTTLSNSDTRPERVRQPRARASAQARVGPQVVLKEDYCTDDTVAVARRLMPTITVVANHRPGGKGNALQTGAEAATGDILVQLDADGSEDPARSTSLWAHC